MTFVADASVLACWLLPDERHPVAVAALARFATESAIAPAMLWFEVRNILIVSERRGRIDTVKTAEALRVLRALPIDIDAQTEEGPLLQLARAHRLTVYDAAYLEIALRRNLPLATLDEALVRAARAEGVILLGAT